MGSKLEFWFEEKPVRAVKKKSYWEVFFFDGSTGKLFLHVNAEKDEVWMWESGKIDDASLSIGRMIEWGLLESGK